MCSDSTSKNFGRNARVSKRKKENNVNWSRDGSGAAAAAAATADGHLLSCVAVHKQKTLNQIGESYPIIILFPVCHVLYRCYALYFFYIE